MTMKVTPPSLLNKQVRVYATMTKATPPVNNVEKYAAAGDIEKYAAANDIEKYALILSLDESNNQPL
jgi:hypothetical protein